MIALAQNVWGGDWLAADKLIHFAVTAGLAALIYVGARSLGWRRRTSILCAGIAVLLIGLARELVDLYLGEVQEQPGKFFSLKDMIWNAAGLTVGLAVAHRWRRRSRRR